MKSIVDFILESEDRYTQGWNDADDAIAHKLPGYRDYSQGDSEWDKGWNTRIEQEEKLERIINK